MTPPRLSRPLVLAVLQRTLNLVLRPPPPGGPGVGSGLRFYLGVRGFGPDSGTDPGPTVFPRSGALVLVMILQYCGIEQETRHLQNAIYPHSVRSSRAGARDTAVTCEASMGVELSNV